MALRYVKTTPENAIHAPRQREGSAAKVDEGNRLKAIRTDLSQRPGLLNLGTPERIERGALKTSIKANAPF